MCIYIELFREKVFKQIGLHFEIKEVSFDCFHTKIGHSGPSFTNKVSTCHFSQQAKSLDYLERRLSIFIQFSL